MPIYLWLGWEREDSIVYMFKEAETPKRLRTTLSYLGTTDTLTSSLPKGNDHRES